MAREWYVDNNRQVVNLSAIRDSATGKATATVHRIVEQRDGSLLRSLWARSGADLSTYAVTQAQAASTTDPLPADPVPGSTLGPPTVPAPSVIAPSDAGFKVWAFDPAITVNNSLVGAAGTLNLTRLENKTGAAMTVNSASVFVNTAGATLANVGFGVWAWGATGALLASSVNANGATATAFQSNGQKVVTFPTPPTVAAGAAFYVGFWFTGTTMPTLARASGTAAMHNVGFAATPFRYATANTGLTTAAPATLGAQTSLGLAWWVATG